jgi:tight adherence protein C
MTFAIIGIAAFTISLYLVLDAASYKQRQVAAQLRRAGNYSVVGDRERELTKGAQERLLLPLIGRLSSMAMRMSPQGTRLVLAQKLQSAGLEISPQAFLAIKMGMPIGLFVLGMIMVAVGLAPVGMGCIGAAALGFILPEMIVGRIIRKRRADMSRNLPDTLDLLCVSVEAGLGFDAAVQKVTEKMTGPLIDELALMMREMQIGESRKQALRNLADRSGTEAVAVFARQIIQADELGTSLGRTLRVQAIDMRIRRQLEAEEKAMKAPIKMLFPTVLFIFPAMFIVILGPAFLNIAGSMPGM